MTKRFLLIFVAAGTLVVLCAVVIHRALGRRERQRTEAAYQITLDSYSQALKPGVTRKEVEGYLRAKGVLFSQELGGNFSEDHAFADLAKIGSEDPPWYCSEIAVYIAFHFAAAEIPNANPRPSDADTLKSIAILRQAEGCL
jgi:hypothetical protein